MRMDPRTRLPAVPGLPCARKVRYASLSAARRSAHGLGDEGGSRAHAYVCSGPRGCGGYHVGHHDADGVDRASERAVRRPRLAPSLDGWPW